jgi:Integral membrane protein TerC family
LPVATSDAGEHHLPTFAPAADDPRRREFCGRFPQNAGFRSTQDNSAIDYLGGIRPEWALWTATTRTARQIGFALAFIFRVALLFALTSLGQLRYPVFVLFGDEFSWRDVILIGGGLFLIAKATFEIHSQRPSCSPPTRLAHRHEHRQAAGRP